MHRPFRSLPVPPRPAARGARPPAAPRRPGPCGQARLRGQRQYGFEIKLPVKGDWSQTPTQPGETTEVAKFKDDRDSDFSTLSIYRFENGGRRRAPRRPARSRGGEAPQTPRCRRRRYGGPGRPTTPRTTSTRLVGRTARWYGVEWEGLPEARGGEVRQRSSATIYEIELEHAERKGYRVGFLAGIVANDAEEYLILFQIPNKLKKVLQPVDQVASAPSASRGGEVTHGSRRGSTEDLEKRDKTRKVDGGTPRPRRSAPASRPTSTGTWRFIDTPHYLVIYNCDDGLAKYIAKRVEYMREYAFETVFPPVAPIEECMIIRVCKEMDEYYHYGAPRGSAGYWSSGRRRARLPRPVPEQEARPEDHRRHAPRGLPPVHPLRAARRTTCPSGSTRASPSTSTASRAKREEAQVREAPRHALRHREVGAGRRASSSRSRTSSR